MYIAICYIEYNLNFIGYICAIYLEGETAGGASTCRGVAVWGSRVYRWLVNESTHTRVHREKLQEMHEHKNSCYLRLVVLWQTLCVFVLFGIFQSFCHDQRTNFLKIKKIK